MEIKTIFEEEESNDLTEQGIMEELTKRVNQQIAADNVKREDILKIDVSTESYKGSKWCSEADPDESYSYGKIMIMYVV